LGVTPEYSDTKNISIENGMFITEQHQKKSSKIAVLGPTVVEDLFGENANPIGATIRINRIDFEIIGVTIAKGGSGMNNFDDIIYIPLNTYRHFLSGTEYVTTINVAAQSQDSMVSVQEQIKALLLKRHKITNEEDADFSLMNQADIIATATSITNTFTILLSSIASISLLVGGIGIMNMMLTTVTERTREIGLRKAVGIRKICINLQFLAEAVILTFLGGVIGVFLGWVASLIIPKFYDSLTTEISLGSIFLAFGVSAAVGVIFGFYPARKAANKSPIEALRHE
jgi:putative ABC transport system permease protein